MITFFIEAVGNLAEEAGGKPSFERPLGYSVALGYGQADAGLKTLGQFVVEGYGWVFVVAAPISLTIAFGTVLWQTLKAAKTNPAIELKKE